MNVHTDRKSNLRRRGGTVSIVTEPENKLLRITFFKRRRLGDNTSFPFGYN